MPRAACADSTDESTLYDILDDTELCQLTLTYNWDGTSVPATGCNGTLANLHLRNSHDGSDTPGDWEAVFDRTGQPHSGDQDIVVFAMGPNSNETIATAALDAVGLKTPLDIGNVFMRQKSAA